MTLFVMWIVFIVGILACISTVIEIINSKGVKTVIFMVALLLNVITTVILYHIVIHGGFNL
ncbi:hypothetical protein LEO2_49 [Bacillus phage Leo2]|jgi:hypothetical protein|uniref:Uncharacterized protein n=1 Tax=Bacillus phage Leo2 TaxID=1815973 RepID=A0A1S5QTT3_9CAUD|nr:hypothetical protein LEO2_49 [Bacillus phage Leo2]